MCMKVVGIIHATMLQQQPYQLFYAVTRNKFLLHEVKPSTILKKIPTDHPGAKLSRHKFLHLSMCKLSTKMLHIFSKSRCNFKIVYPS